MENATEPTFTVETPATLQMSYMFGERITEMPEAEVVEELGKVMQKYTAIAYGVQVENISLEDMARHIMREVDEAIARIPAEECGGIHCHESGCNECCHMDVMLSQPEWRVIMEYVKQNKVDLNVERLREKQCPFLNKEGKCSVYEVRPLTCRTCLVSKRASRCDQGEEILFIQDDVCEQIIAAFWTYCVEQGKKELKTVLDFFAKYIEAN